MCLFNPGIAFQLSRQTVSDIHENHKHGSSGSSKPSATTQSTETWEPTLKLLLLSEKPIIVTAAGAIDFYRDMKVWRKVVKELNVKEPHRDNESNTDTGCARTVNGRYELRYIISPDTNMHSASTGAIKENLHLPSNNPFRSYKQHIDEKDTEQPLLTPNYIVYALQLVNNQ